MEESLVIKLPQLLQLSMRIDDDNNKSRLASVLVQQLQCFMVSNAERELNAAEAYDAAVM